MLHERTAPHLAALAAAPRAVEQARTSIAGLLTVTTTSDLGEALLAAMVARFTALHPAVRVRVLLTTRVVDLVADGVDFALRAARPSEADLVARQVTSIELGLYAAPAYLQRRGTPTRPGELRAHDLVVARPPHVARVRVRGLLDLRAPPRIEADSFEFARAVARAGGGIALLPTFLAAAEVGEGRLVRLLASRSVHAPVFLVYAAARLPARSRAFRDFALAAFAEQRGTLVW